MMTRRVGVFLMGAVLLTACASTGSEGPRRNYDVITTEEIEAANVSNLYQLVERLRPRWLDVRSQRSYNTSTEIVVFQGQTYLGGPAILREMGADGAHTLRYIDGATASATLPGLGSRQIEGAIVINPGR